MIKLISTFTPSTPIAFTHPNHPHLDTSGPLTHPVILLLNALLTQKRIIFLGYGHPSGEVANYVLAACAMGSGCGTVLKGFTERAFPYANLTSVDDLLNWYVFLVDMILMVSFKFYGNSLMGMLRCLFLFLIVDTLFIYACVHFVILSQPRLHRWSNKSNLSRSPIVVGRAL